MKPQLRHTGAKVAQKGSCRFEKGMPLQEEFGTDRIRLVLATRCLFQLCFLFDNYMFGFYTLASVEWIDRASRTGSTFDLRFDRKCDVDCGKMKAAKPSKAAKPAAKTSKPKNLDLGGTKYYQQLRVVEFDGCEQMGLGTHDATQVTRISNAWIYLDKHQACRGKPIFGFVQVLRFVRFVLSVLYVSALCTSLCTTMLFVIGYGQESA